MTDPLVGAQAGLPWPEDFATLLPLVRDRWGVQGDIYLSRKLSGKSGAAVYATDIVCRDFSGQSILKLDTAPDPADQERSEAERHQAAYDNAPDYAALHLPKLLHTLQHDNRIAVLSTIAGRGLEYAQPWAELAHTAQLATTRELSKGLLEDWNSDCRLADGLLSPQDLLRGWLRYRLDPQEGRLFGFLKDECGLSPDEKTVFFEGTWYPNPLAFAIDPPEKALALRRRAIIGNIHGDLHGFNVLVRTAGAGDPAYYLIDLAFFEENQFLLFDHGYFELSDMLMMRGRTDTAHWCGLLDHLSPFVHSGESSELRGDDLGLVELIGAMRSEVADWVERHQANRLSDMENQYLMARVAAGLNFASKRIEPKTRRMAFLYAAANLKDYLKFNGLDWPKHGPAFDIDVDRGAGVEVASSQADATDQSIPAAPAKPPPERDRPSIAVLPFENLTGDPQQGHFAEGITQEIITTLSLVDWLMVIASSPSFANKRQFADIKQLGNQLGVQYVVEGSVRGGGERVRISVQLTDAQTSHHLWAERFDRNVEDILDLQEEIADAIAANIDSELRFAERERAQRQGDIVGQWTRFQKALWHYFKLNEEHTAIARESLIALTEEFPDYADAHALLALVDCRAVSFCEAEDPATLLKVAMERATRAVTLDGGSSNSRVAFSRASMLVGRHAAAVEQAQLAVSDNPSSSIARICLATAFFWSGRAAEALPIIETSLRLSPRGPFRDIERCMSVLCHYVLGETEKAAKLAEQVAHGRFVGPYGLLSSAVVFSRIDRLADARSSIDELVRQRPNLRSRWSSAIGNIWRPTISTCCLRICAPPDSRNSRAVYREARTSPAIVKLLRPDMHWRMVLTQRGQRGADRLDANVSPPSRSPPGCRGPASC